jgi:peptidoglycan/LPS O-acetylase OafA/YrhL
VESGNLGGAPTEKLLAVQVLRALAALMVAIAHASEEAIYFFGFYPPFNSQPLGKGVDLFFVVSGFIIYYSSIRLFQTSRPVITFLRNRALRVIPLYYLFTTLMVVAVLAFPSGVKEARLDIAQIVSSYFFLPYERYDGRIAPILSLGWTLNYEMFFYAIFAISMWLRGKQAAWYCLGSLVVLSLIGAFLPTGVHATVRAWTSSIVLEFGMGILIALAYERWGGRWRTSTINALALIFLGFALLYILNLPEKVISAPRFVTAGLPAAMMLWSAVMLLPMHVERALPSFLIAMGDSSYSLYLSHRFIQRPIQIAISHSNFGSANVAGLLYVVVAVVAAVAFAHVVYLGIERPMLRRLRSPRASGLASRSASL